MLQSRTVREGTVGLFALLGLVLVGAVAVWLRGGGFGNPTYNLLVEFDNASGLQVGAPVMFRGVSVGKIAGLRPSSNGIEAVLQIASTKLRIPRNSTIQISRFGLIGEASVDIMPQPKSQLQEQELALDPTAKDCKENAAIFCDGDRVRGETGSQLVSSLTQLSKTYSSPEFVANLNATARNAAIAANRIAKMSDEIALLSKTARYQIRGVGQTTQAIANTARSADQLTQNLNRIVVMNQASLSQTINNSAQLMQNLNQLVLENRSQVTGTLRSIQTTSQDVQQLSRRLQNSVELLDTSLISVTEGAKNVNQGVTGINQGINALDMPKLAQDLQIVLANAAETSQNLREISQNFNDPTIFLNIQKTLDSARASFENVNKITADVEQITGDPAFVKNLKKLVDGLGSLVSSTEQLQQQLYADRVLIGTSQQLKYQIDVQQRLVLLQNPTTTSPNFVNPNPAIASLQSPNPFPKNSPQDLVKQSPR